MLILRSNYAGAFFDFLHNFSF
jgi:hypothetical protein